MCDGFGNAMSAAKWIKNNKPPNPTRKAEVGGILRRLVNVKN